MSNPAVIDDFARPGPGAEGLLRSSGPARVAYTGTDGYPRVVPVGFLWTGPAIVFTTATSAPKLTALRARPQVAVTIDTFPESRALLLRGTVDIEIVDGVPDEYIAMAAKSSEGDELAAFERHVRDTYDEMARFTLVPDWVRFFDFNGGPLPGFLRRLIESGSG